MEGKKRTSAHTLPPSASLHAEIGGANGPQQLSALVLQFGPHLNPQHLSTALSKLAGFAVGAAGGGGLPAEDAEAVARTASRCAAVLRYKCDQLVDPLQVWGSVNVLRRSSAIALFLRPDIYAGSVCRVCTCSTVLDVQPPDDS